MRKEDKLKRLYAFVGLRDEPADAPFPTSDRLHNAVRKIKYPATPAQLTKRNPE